MTLWGDQPTRKASSELPDSEGLVYSPWMGNFRHQEIPAPASPSHPKAGTHFSSELCWSRCSQDMAAVPWGSELSLCSAPSQDGELLEIPTVPSCSCITRGEGQGSASRAQRAPAAGTEGPGLGSCALSCTAQSQLTQGRGTPGKCLGIAAKCQCLCEGPWCQLPSQTQ